MSIAVSERAVQFHNGSNVFKLLSFSDITQILIHPAPGTAHPKTKDSKVEGVEAVVLLFKKPDGGPDSIVFQIGPNMGSVAKTASTIDETASALLRRVIPGWSSQYTDTIVKSFARKNFVPCYVGSKEGFLLLFSTGFAFGMKKPFMWYPHSG